MEMKRGGERKRKKEDGKSKRIKKIRRRMESGEDERE